MSKYIKTQTDNSWYYEKVKLRLLSIEQIAEKNISVLEWYGGKGRLWDAVKKQSRKNITTTRIDLKPNLPGVHLKGDNIKYLRSLDLGKYNIIDLDAYGIPFTQLSILSKRKWSGIVHVTHIQTVMGNLPNGLLEAYGITEVMYGCTRTLFAGLRTRPIMKWLARKGVKKVTGYFYDSKNYFYFHMEDN